MPPGSLRKKKEGAPKKREKERKKMYGKECPGWTGISSMPEKGSTGNNCPRQGFVYGALGHRTRVG